MRADVISIGASDGSRLLSRLLILVGGLVFALGCSAPAANRSAQPSATSPPPATTQANARPAPEMLVLELDGRRGADAFSDAQARLAGGDYARLLDEAEEVIEDEPDSGLAHEVRGAALLGLGKVTEAAAAFRRAAEVDPKRSGPWTKLGIVQMESGAVDEALTSLRRAIEINDSDRFAHQRLGLIYEYRGDVARAIHHLQRGLDGAPKDYVGVAVNLSRLLSGQGRHKEAADVLRARLASSHSDPIAHLVLASALYSNGEFAAARERYAGALELDRTLVEAKLGEAMAHRELGDTGRSLQLLDEIVADRSAWAPAVIERGKTLMKMGRSSEAAAAFDRYVALGGDEDNVTRYRAQIQLKSTQPAKAEDTYAKALASGSASPETYAEASEVYLSRGNTARGEQVLREGIQRFPTNAYLVMRLGAYLAAVTRYREAVPVLEQARAMAPDDPAILRMLAVARTRHGDVAGSVEPAARLYETTRSSDAAVLYAGRLEANQRLDEAERVYREVLAREPQNALALNNLAALLTRTNKLDEAERLARQATAQAPDNGHVFDTLGWVQYRRGQREDAATLLARAVSLAPGEGILRYHQGVVLESLGRRDEAREALKEAVRLEDGSEWVSDARSRLAALN